MIIPVWSVRERTTGRNWYYVTDGKVDTGVNGLCYVSINGTEGWYNFKDGMLTGAYISWWSTMVPGGTSGEGGEVDFSYTGVCRE